MGNRAVLEFQGSPVGTTTPGVYLHWNGGRPSVEAFLSVARQFRDNLATPESRADTVARVALAYIGSSVYVGAANNMDRDNYDNGVFVIDDRLQIVGREYMPASGEEQDEGGRSAAIIAETEAKITALGADGFYALKPQQA